MFIHNFKRSILF